MRGIQRVVICKAGASKPRPVLYRITTWHSIHVTRSAHDGSEANDTGGSDSASCRGSNVHCAPTTHEEHATGAFLSNTMESTRPG